MNRRLFHTLDGVRGVAAIAVVILHGQGATDGITLPGAYLAVDLFFMLSGFVIARSYEHRFAGDLSVKSFAVTRFLRLYPLYALGTIIGVFSGAIALAIGKSYLSTTEFAAAAISSLLMLPTVFTSWQLYPLNTPAWSLFFEIIVNVLHAFTYRRLSNINLVALIAASAAMLIAAAMWRGSVDVGLFTVTLVMGLPRVMFSYFMGVLISRILIDSPSSKSYAVTFVFPLLLLVFLVTNVNRVVFDLLCVGVVFPAVIWACVRYEHPWTRIMTFLGAISYPLYAIHYPIIQLVIRVGKAVHFDITKGPPLFGIALVVALVIAAAWLAKVDVQVRRAIGARLNVRPSATTTT